MPKNIVARIRKFNKKRNPDILKLKWQAMKESPFRFFRGACPLFYEDPARLSHVLSLYVRRKRGYAAIYTSKTSAALRVTTA